MSGMESRRRKRHEAAKDERHKAAEDERHKAAEEGGMKPQKGKADEHFRQWKLGVSKPAGGR